MRERQAPRSRGGVGRRVVVGSGAILLALLLLSTASAQTVARPASREAARGKGLTPAERKALRIVSVQAVGAEPLGVVVTATFAGNIEQALGRGHLKNGVVALILRPKSTDFAPADVATRGAGAIGETLAKTQSKTVGVVRRGKTIRFLVGGPGFANVGKVEVKAFAAAPAAGSRSLAEGIPAEYWEQIESQIAAEDAAILAPPPATSCEELTGLQRVLDSLLADAKARTAQLRKLKQRLEHAIRTFNANQISNADVAFAGALEVLAGGFVRGTLLRQHLDIRDQTRIALRRLRLDVRLAEALIEKNQDLVEKIARIQGQVAALTATRCGGTGETPGGEPQPKLAPIHAAFDQATFTTTYTENAVAGWTEDGLFSAFLAPKGFGRDPSDRDLAFNSGSGQNAAWDARKQEWLDTKTGAALSPSAALTYAWNVAIPADPDCARGFKGNAPQANQATWYHADASQGGPCNHSGKASGPRGHPGTVTVVVTSAGWSCTAVYHGTEGDNGSPVGDGDAPSACVPR